jgi:Flp pilus assembly protein TadG
MNMMSPLRSALARFGQFRRHDRGNVMITFALAIIPVIGAVGAAVDYSRGNSRRRSPPRRCRSRARSRA